MRRYKLSENTPSVVRKPIRPRFSEKREMRMLIGLLGAMWFAQPDPGREPRRDTLSKAEARKDTRWRTNRIC